MYPLASSTTAIQNYDILLRISGIIHIIVLHAVLTILPYHLWTCLALLLPIIFIISQLKNEIANFKTLLRYLEQSHWTFMREVHVEILTVLILKIRHHLNFIVIAEIAILVLYCILRLATFSFSFQFFY